MKFESCHRDFLSVPPLILGLLLAMQNANLANATNHFEGFEGAHEWRGETPGLRYGVHSAFENSQHSLKPRIAEH